jgi:hypothetical protein
MGIEYHLNEKKKGKSDGFRIRTTGVLLHTTVNIHN